MPSTKGKVPPPTAPASPPDSAADAKVKSLNITDLKDMSIQRLTQIAKELNVAGTGGMRNRI